jgi:opacity protein-like surface antigen
MPSATSCCSAPAASHSASCAARHSDCRNPTSAGWTAGVGAEFGFAPSWSAKVEYLYVDLANSNFTITGLSNGYRFGLVRAGVNYHF